MKKARGSVFSLGLHYHDSPHQSLPSSSSDANRLQTFFAGWGFITCTECAQLSNASAREIVDALENWSDIVRNIWLTVGAVLYVAGHGRLHYGRHYILTALSPTLPPYFGGKAISVEDLAQAMLNTGASKGLILLDACYSGFAADEIQRALDRVSASQGTPAMDLAVLVPSLHHERTYSGLFIENLLDALQYGSEGGHWKDGDEFVTLYELRDELRLRLNDDQCAYVTGRDGLKIFPNPRYRATAADRAVELGNLLSQLTPEEREHFLSKSASADAGDVGWYFTGREAATRHIVGWLDDDTSGMLVITGEPGSGKSALIGRLAVLADTASQSACRVLGLLDNLTFRPALNSFDAIVYIRKRRADDVARDIARQIGLDLSASSSPPRDLVTGISDSNAKVTVLADALDEAEDGHETLVARDVLRAIANLPKCRVIVGTRRDRESGYDGTDFEVSPIIDTLRPRVGRFHIIDLSLDGEVDADIEAYVANKLARPALLASWPNAGRRRIAATMVAEQARRVFLYARFAIRVLESLDESILAEPQWQSRLPSAVGESGLDQVFAEDLSRFPNPTLFIDVLRPLAFARGKGIPRRQIWPELATALASASSGRAYSAADISRVIREAGWYLIEATEDGQAVYRLYHQSIADYLRREALIG